MHDWSEHRVKHMVAHLLQNHCVEVLVLLLVLLDVGFVFVETGLDMGFLCISGKQVSYGSLAGEHLYPDSDDVGECLSAQALGSLEPEPHHRSSSFASEPAAAACKKERRHRPEVLVCAGPGDHHVEHLEHICHWGSVSVLLIFLLEILLKMWSIPDWFALPLHKLDLFVVVMSLLFDTVVQWTVEAFMTRHGGQASSAVKADIDIVVIMLLLARFWRVARIVYAFVEIEEKRAEIAEHAHHESDTAGAESKASSCAAAAGSESTVSSCAAVAGQGPRLKKGAK